MSVPCGQVYGWEFGIILSILSLKCFIAKWSCFSRYLFLVLGSKPHNSQVKLVILVYVQIYDFKLRNQLINIFKINVSLKLVCLELNLLDTNWIEINSTLLFSQLIESICFDRLICQDFRAG